MVVKVIVSRLCWILCDPRDCSLPGSSVHGISQALQADSLPSEPPGKPPYSSCLDKWDFGSLVKYYVAAKDTRGKKKTMTCKDVHYMLDANWRLYKIYIV